jgi:hypothetical protein
MSFLIFLYQLQFKFLKPNTQKLIKQLELEVLEWNGVTSGVHPMGGIEFSFRGKEIGHIHWNGDLDIVFGKKKTTELLKTGKVCQHRFVPTSAITFPLVKRGDAKYGLALLRFSYLRILKSKVQDPGIEAFVERELVTLPVELQLFAS